MLAIKCNGLYKNYGDNIILNGVNMEVHENEIYALIGKNGAGKTTFLRCVLGIIDYEAGEITTFKNKNSIGVSLDWDWFYPQLTGRENLEVFINMKGKTGVESERDLIELFEMENNMNKKFSEYSLGMKKKLSIIYAMMNEPQILILDEPFNGLDPINTQILTDYLLKLKSEGLSIIISSHSLYEVSIVADVIGILNNGNLIEKTMEEIRDEQSSYIELVVDNIEIAMYLLESKLEITNFTFIEENRLLIHDLSVATDEIVNVLNSNNIRVKSINMHEDNFEEIIVEMLKEGE